MYVYCNFYCSPAKKHGLDLPTFLGLATPLESSPEERQTHDKLVGTKMKVAEISPPIETETINHIADELRLRLVEAPTYILTTFWRSYVYKYCVTFLLYLLTYIYLLKYCVTILTILTYLYISTYSLSNLLNIEYRYRCPLHSDYRYKYRRYFLQHVSVSKYRSRWQH